MITEGMLTKPRSDSAFLGWQGCVQYLGSSIQILSGSSPLASQWRSSLQAPRTHQTGSTQLSSVEARTSGTQGMLVHLHCYQRRALPR